MSESAGSSFTFRDWRRNLVGSLARSEEGLGT